jgi:hypothetical protein
VSTFCYSETPLTWVRTRTLGQLENPSYIKPSSPHSSHMCRGWGAGRPGQICVTETQSGQASWGTESSKELPSELPVLLGIQGPPRNDGRWTINFVTCSNSCDYFQWTQTSCYYLISLLNICWQPAMRKALCGRGCSWFLALLLTLVTSCFRTLIFTYVKCGWIVLSSLTLATAPSSPCQSCSHSALLSLQCVLGLLTPEIRVCVRAKVENHWIRISA